MVNMFLNKLFQVVQGKVRFCRPIGRAWLRVVEGTEELFFPGIMFGKLFLKIFLEKQ